MKKRTTLYWPVGLLLVFFAFIFLREILAAEKKGDRGEVKSAVAGISTIRSMENGVKWTRCFRAADDTVFFEDHRMSNDGGRTVVAQRNIDVEGINDQPERAVLATEGVLYALHGSTEMVTPGVYRAKAWRSSDGLRTIHQEEVTINVPEGPARKGKSGEYWYGVYIYRTIIEMPDGTWLMTMYGNFATDNLRPFEADAQKELAYMQRTFVVTSTDEGRTWSYLSTVASPRAGDPVGEGFVEPAITLLNDGRLLCVMRSGHHFPLYASWSEDAGKSWSFPMYTGLDRGCDPCLITLHDGRVALSWGRRYPEGWSIVDPDGDQERFKRQYPGHGYTNLAISDDGGLSWINHKIMKRSGSCYSTIIEVEPNVVFMLVDQWYCRITLQPKHPIP